MSGPRTVVGAVRVRGARDGTLALALPRTLGQLSLRPDGLSPRAVLVVRHLDDPLPGVLDAGPAGPAAPAWERAATSALTAKLRGAARPSDGPVPAGAGAVLFDHRAQLLAALAGDWLAGAAPSRWWWREFLRYGTVADAVARAWRDDAREVPVALELLAARALAVRFARALPPVLLAALVTEVAAAWGAPLPVTAGAAPGPQAPWSAWVPEAQAAGLPAMGRALLGIGLALARAPATATRPEFWRRVAAWWQDAGAAGPQRPAATVPGQPPDQEGAGPGPAGVVEDPPGGAGPPPALGGAAHGTPAEPVTHEPERRAAARLQPFGQPGDGAARAAHPAAQPAAHPAAHPARRSSAPGPAARQPARLRSPVPGTGRRPPAPVVTAASAPAAPASPPAPPAGAGGGGARSAGAQPGECPGQAVVVDGPGETDWDAGSGGGVIATQRVHTELGGLFFLLNVALARGLYGDFARPAAPGIPLSPWDLLALLGGVLLGQTASADDPVWALLAALAGRPDQAGPRVPRAMRRWVGRLAADVRRELGQALGCEAGKAAALLIRASARVDATATDVDVVMHLADLAIAVRMAGLDRDPGWIPASGRTITFHFE